jgi:SAM-dependent methyltransferase
MNDRLMNWEDAVVWMRNQPDMADLVRACFYDDPLLEAAERYYSSSEWLAIKALLIGDVGRALDLGAGRGISSFALAKDGWQVDALEPDPSDIVGAGAIRYLSLAAHLDISVAQNWGENLPYGDATFDLVHGRQVLHHATDLRQLCREVGRVLKPGGLFIATREHVISRPADLPAFLESHPLHRLYGGENAYLKADYVSAIEGGGLGIIRIFNPYQSDINLFPETIDSLRASIARRLHIPKGVVPDLFLTTLGARLKTPGRLYTFLGRKDG